MSQSKSGTSVDLTQQWRRASQVENIKRSLAMFQAQRTIIKDQAKFVRLMEVIAKVPVIPKSGQFPAQIIDFDFGRTANRIRPNSSAA